jgi:4-diphosphocytidyl-2C-methyl-D-erythritol kinase
MPAAISSGRPTRPTMRSSSGKPDSSSVWPSDAECCLAIAVSTPDVFAAFDAIRHGGDSAVRMSSAHLAEELRAGLTADNLVARAGVLASANDLLPATALVVPALVPFKRALSRLLGRPIGLSGSGPTLWALYPSGAEATAAAETVRSALADGGLAAPGTAPAFVCATTIVGYRQEGNPS